jgi:hypothetical protein
MRNGNKTTTPHPLEPLVIKAFEGRAHHDGTSLGCFLAGDYARAGANKAYAKVACEVLGCMEAQRKLTRDDCGWWRRPTDDRKPVRAEVERLQLESAGSRSGRRTRSPGRIGQPQH